MELSLATYDVALVVLALVTLGAVVVPRALSDRVLSFPLVFVAFGLLVFALPLGLEPTHPLDEPVLTEHITELGVIIALTGLGLKIDRPISVRLWSSTWRLLAITMPLTIGAAALLGWWLAGLVPAAAVLLGAVLAPTDPVLAAEVQTDDPVTVHDEEIDAGREARPDPEEIDPATAEDEVRFALSSEAALNDGLAFPFTNAAIAMALFGAGPSGWMGRWLWLDVGYRIVAGLAVGYLVGWVLARVLFRGALREDRPVAVEEILVIVITLAAYGAAEVANGYGFLAVFVSAYTIRDYERKHGVHDVLHHAADQLERLFMGVILVLLGGALLDGLLSDLTARGALVVVLLVLVVRPVAGWIGLLGDGSSSFRRSIIAWFGIRGIGSAFYLAHAFNEAEFAQAREVWSIVAGTILLSLVVHGLSGQPLMRRYDAHRERGAAA